MAKFEKLQTVYQVILGEHDGERRPMVVPVVISAVCPQRDGSFRYHLRTWDGVVSVCSLGAFNVSEASLEADPMEAMRRAVAAIGSPQAAPSAPQPKGD